MTLMVRHEILRFKSFPVPLPGARWIAIETGGMQRYDEVHYARGDVLVFGSERRGLSEAALAALPTPQLASLPMLEGNRSLNLSNSVAVVVYEAWRQTGFAGAADAPNGERAPGAN